MKAVLASRGALLAPAPQQHRDAASPIPLPLGRVLESTRTPMQLSLFFNAPRGLSSAARLASPVLRTSLSKGSGQVAA